MSHISKLERRINFVLHLLDKHTRVTACFGDHAVEYLNKFSSKVKTPYEIHEEFKQVLKLLIDQKLVIRLLDERDNFYYELRR